MIKLSYSGRSWLSPNAWLLGLVLSISPVALWAQDVVQNFALHEEPRPLADLQFENGKGQPLSIAAFRGKVVVLNIWATWCPPCVREMPTLDQLQARLGGADFEVVALSIDRAGLDVVRKFYANIGVKHLAEYIDSAGEVTRVLGVVGLPTTLLIDREGRELGRLVGPAEWDTPEMIEFFKRHVDNTSSLLAPTPTRLGLGGSRQPVGTGGKQTRRRSLDLPVTGIPI